jgi:Holliday junction resolvase RusA-like endonuclease
LYLPKSHKVHSYKAAIRAAFIEAAGKWRTITGPVELAVYLRFEMPSSWSKLKRQNHIGTLHCGKPDADNIGKAICDALTDCGAWQDDKQVAIMFISKRWSDGPQTAIRIEEAPCRD